MAFNQTEYPATQSASPDCQQYLDVNTLLKISFFCFLSSILTHSLRWITPGVITKETTVPEDSETTAPEPEVQGLVPPDYVTPNSGPARDTPKPESSAELFVNGTSILILLFGGLLFAGIEFQYMFVCLAPGSIFQVMLGLLFSLSCLWASVGFCCWVMLLRDLWGLGMRKMVPIDEWIVIKGLLLLATLPFLFVGWVQYLLKGR
jgi:hypothetical protein